MSAYLEVIAPGLMATVQDLGRIGYQAQGVPVSGAMDMGNLRVANALVGNDQGEGALEFRILSPTFRVCAERVSIALTGTQGYLEVWGESRLHVPAYRSVQLQRGDMFRVKDNTDSAVCYLAVGGGFDVPEIYGSKSTYLAGKMGGFNGRVLQAGDHLPLCCDEPPVEKVSICSIPFSYREEGPVMVVSGPQADYFTDAGHETFFSQSYQVTVEVNRMGMRLAGATVEHSKGADINSDGIVTGAIQVPGSGLPIILLADHQTTGGYPKIGVVASADIPRLGRMAPGAAFRFQSVSVETAEEARRRLEARIASVVAGIVSFERQEDLLDFALYQSNLISGAVAE